MDGSLKPKFVPKRVGDMVVSPAVTLNGKSMNRGPFKTKAGGSLNVAFAVSFDDVMNFLSYDKEETNKIPGDVRGMRMYINHLIPLVKEVVGGTEFHRVRQEIVVGIQGMVRWECEDVWNEKREFILTPGSCIIQPPFIMHTYKVLEDQSGMMILANTLFDPDADETKDTFSLEDFHKLQKRYIKVSS